MHRTSVDLETHLDDILASPSGKGVIELITVRPDIDERKVVTAAQLDPELGLIGDNWKERGSSHTEDGSANPLAQVTVMNSRVARAVGGDIDNWPLAGDQFYVDLDLSPGSLPVGTRIRLGSAVIEVSTQPHTGCKKFAGRFGVDALRFVNTGAGRERRFRGINALVVEGGEVNVGDIAVLAD